MSYRVLLLDWDGTVRDSIGCIVGCAMEALAASGLEGDEHGIRATVGLDIEESIRRWAPGATNATLQAVQDSYRDGWIGTWHARAELVPLAAETLLSLHRQGYWLTVATGKGRVGLNRDFSVLAPELRELFLATRTADETQSKPSPSMVLSILEELGVEANEALVVGDSSFDMAMAKNAGCDGVGVLGGAGDEAELLGSGASVVLPGFAELPGWLNRS